MTEETKDQPVPPSGEAVVPPPKPAAPPTKEEKDWDLEIIEKTTNRATLLREANKKLRRELTIAKQLETEAMLGGKAEGNVTPPKPDSPKEYAEKVMANEIETTEES